MTTLLSNLVNGITLLPRNGLVATLMSMAAISHQRRQLRDLDDAMLADLGLTRTQAEAESRRTAWDVPATWRR